MLVAAATLLTPLPNSGTAQREMARGIVTGIGGAAGALAGGYPGAAAGIVGGAAAPGIAGRTIMSKPVQGYLRNQKGAGLSGAVPSPALRTGIVAGESAAEDYLANPGQQGLQ